jgi:methyltransferase
MTVAILVLALAFIPMAFEARLAARHDRALRAAGASEPQDDVFPVMQVTYPAAFLAMTLEALLRGAPIDSTLAGGVLVFALAKAVKYWAIATLGPRWTFRVLVPSDSTLVHTGPYRFMRHPNYLGVMGELVGMSLIAHAVFAGPVAVVLFGAIIAARIRVEERALDRVNSP